MKSFPAAEKLILIQPELSAAGERGPFALRVDETQYETSWWEGIGDPAQQLCLARRKPDPQAAKTEVQIPIESFSGRFWHLAWVESLHPADLQGGPVANFVMRQLQPGTGEGLVPAILAQADLILNDWDCLSFSLFEVDGSHSTLLGITTWPDAAAFNAYAGWAKNHPWKDTIGPRTLAVPLRLLGVKVTPSA